MKSTFKPRLEILEDHLTPTSLGLTSPDFVPPPPPPDGADSFASQSAEAEGGSTVIVCDDLVVKGDRPKK
jgi:hypothetical protein